MGYFDFLSRVKKPTQVVMPTKGTAGNPEKVTTNTRSAKVLPSLNFTRRDKKSSSDKRANDSALALRSLIVGPTSPAALHTKTTISKPNLNHIKSQLMEPKTANKVITHLKAMAASDDPLDANKPNATGPINAVCLAYTDAEIDALHFANLISPSTEREIVMPPAKLPGVLSAPVDKLAALFNEMNIIHLVNAPDLGLGQPGDAPGILAGALPTAETVIEGVKKITPELMALGYATGKAVMPDHTGIYPPTDRMSVLTYWWGLELLLPRPSLAYLANAQSITNAVMNFLSALALINTGVQEILPFIRYISQYVDFEFNTIKRQDKGKGVVCAATWIMPVALVPRPWDFPTRPTSTATKPSSDAVPSASIPHDAPKPQTEPASTTMKPPDVVPPAAIPAIPTASLEPPSENLKTP